MEELCIFCKNPVNKRLFCKKHSILFAKQINFVKDKIKNTSSINDYYHNLRYSIMKAGNIDAVIELSIRLIALAYIKYIKTNDMTLFDKSIFEVKNIYSNKTNFLFSVNNKLDDYKKGNLDFLICDFLNRKY